MTIDGPRAAHEAVRGPTYDLVLDDVRRAVTRNVFASMTFTRENVGELERTLEGVPVGVPPQLDRDAEDDPPLQLDLVLTRPEWRRQ